MEAKHKPFVPDLCECLRLDVTHCLLGLSHQWLNLCQLLIYVFLPVGTQSKCSVYLYRHDVTNDGQSVSQRLIFLIIFQFYDTSTAVPFKVYRAL